MYYSLHHLVVEFTSEVLILSPFLMMDSLALSDAQALIRMSLIILPLESPYPHMSKRLCT